MDVKQWVKPIIILAALVAIYLLTQVWEGRHTTASDAVFDIDLADISRVLVEVDGVQAELLHADTTWVLAGYERRELRPWRIDNFTRMALGIKRESMISRNPAKWAVYGVSDSASHMLAVYGHKGKLVNEILVGRSSTNWQSSYIRQPGDNEVYLTSESIFHLLSADTSFWLEPLPEPDTTKSIESDA